MATSVILGQNNISGRVGSGVVIRRELNRINSRVKTSLSDRQNPLGYLRSIQNKGNYYQTNYVVDRLIKLYSNNPNVRKGSIRREYLRMSEGIVNSGLSVAKAKTQVAKGNISRASRQNVRRGLSGTTIRRAAGTITQGNYTYKITSGGGFERIGISGKQKGIRERIRLGTSTAKDIYAGANPRTARGQATILRRLANSIKSQERNRRVESQFEVMSGTKDRSPSTLSQSQKIAQLKKLGILPSRSQGIKSNITFSEQQKLLERAEKIEKRGEKLNEDELNAILFLKGKIQIQRARSDKVLDKLPPSVASLSKLGTKSSQKLNNYMASFTVSQLTLPSRLAQVIDKSLFVNQAGVSAAMRRDFKNQISLQLKENKRISPSVQSSLKRAFKDPSTYIFALLGASVRGRNPIKTNESPVVINKPLSGSPTANVLKNRLVVDKKSKSLYYVDKTSNVARVKVGGGRIELVYPRGPQFNYKKLGFETKNQYSQWVKLNEISRVSTGRKLAAIEKKIAKLEKSIITAKNKRVLSREKSKLVNLGKARKRRGKPPKIQISQSAKKRADLAKSNLAKSKKTRALVKKRGFNNLVELRKAQRLGFITKKQLISFQKAIERASLGNKRANTQVLNVFKAISRKKAKARKQAQSVRLETLALKKKIQVARGKSRRRSIKSNKTTILSIIEKVRIKGKKAQYSMQKFGNVFEIKLITKPKLRTKRGLSLRSGKALNLPKYRLSIARKYMRILSPRSKSKLKQTEILNELLKPAEIQALEEAVSSVIKDLVINDIKNQAKQSTGASTTSLKRGQSSRGPRTKPKQKPKALPPKLKLPKFKVEFDSKKLENKVLTFKGSFRERKYPNRKAGKLNPIVKKTITLRDTRNRALKRVAARVDNSLSASLDLKVVGVGKAKKDIKLPQVLKKFRLKKSKSTPVLRLVEKSKFRFDKRGEKSQSKQLRKKK